MAYLLLQQLNSFVSKDIQKKRINSGYVITNIKLEEETIVENPTETTNYDILDEFKQFVHPSFSQTL